MRAALLLPWRTLAPRLRASILRASRRLTTLVISSVTATAALPNIEATVKRRAATPYLRPCSGWPPGRRAPIWHRKGGADGRCPRRPPWGPSRWLQPDSFVGVFGGFGRLHKGDPLLWFFESGRSEVHCVMRSRLADSQRQGRASGSLLEGHERLEIGKTKGQRAMAVAIGFRFRVSSSDDDQLADKCPRA